MNMGCCNCEGYHEFDLSWVLCTIKKLANDYKNLDENFTNLKNYVESYFKNLDLSNEVQEIIDGLVEDGTIQNMLTEIITDTGSYSNSNLVKQCLYAVGMSYFMNAWTTRNPNLTYGNIEDGGGIGTALDENVEVYGRMDCSTFILLCLMGVNYADSPYNGVPIPRFGNLGFDRQFINTVNNDTGQMRWAYEILQYAAMNNMLYDYTDVKQLQTGDVVFFCWNDDYVAAQSETWWGKNTYEHCAHVGMIVDSCSDFASGVGLLQCVNTSALMQFTDLTTYINTLESNGKQHFYTKVFRPRLNCSKFYINGLIRFRGDVAKLPLVINKSGYMYSGGRMPTNMSSNAVSKSDGSLSLDNSRFTTFFIPYNRSMFINGTVEGCSYHYCYYTGEQVYIDYSENAFEEHEDAKLVRIEWFTSDGSDMTPTQKNQIQSVPVLTYHLWCDTPQSFNCKLSADLQELDTLFWFSEAASITEGEVMHGV